jgi:hypothetical protein
MFRILLQRSELNGGPVSRSKHFADEEWSQVDQKLTGKWRDCEQQFP